MNREEIFKIADECFSDRENNIYPDSDFVASNRELECFVRRIEAATKERCAKVCEGQRDTELKFIGTFAVGADRCAAAIRAME